MSLGLVFSIAFRLLLTNFSINKFPSHNLQVWIKPAIKCSFCFLWLSKMGKFASFAIGMVCTVHVYEFHFKKLAKVQLLSTLQHPIKMNCCSWDYRYITVSGDCTCICAFKLKHFPLCNFFLDHLAFVQYKLFGNFFFVLRQQKRHEKK